MLKLKSSIFAAAAATLLLASCGQSKSGSYGAAGFGQHPPRPGYRGVCSGNRGFLCQKADRIKSGAAGTSIADPLGKSCSGASFDTL